MRPIRPIWCLLLLLFTGPAAAAERWFDPQAVALGKQLFQQHCAVCHGSEAEGTANWKLADADGYYPPPPLNGTAHAWHHPIAQLARSIREGGVKIGGRMPPFGERLNNGEILALIAYFQSKWPDEIYQAWQQRFLQ